MHTRLQTRPPDGGEIVALFDRVAEGMAHAVDNGDSRFDLDLTGPAGVPPGGMADSGIPPRKVTPEEHLTTETRVRLAAGNLLAALDRLHERPAFFHCRTRGEIGGPLLEVALLADHHLMHPDAILIPGGLFDDYVPRALGWSRLFERAGPARATALLFTCPGIDAARALASGLCEEIGDAESAPSGHATTASLSATASRLIQEIGRRATRTGGMTPGQVRVLERAAFALAFSCDDPKEGISAFFADRPAAFASGNTGEQDPVNR